MPDEQFTHSTKSFYYRLAVVSFALNWVWEIGQMVVFAVSASWIKSLIFCTLAAVFDLLTTFAVYGVAAFIARRLDWKQNYRRFYLTAAVLGALSAVMFEKIAFVAEWWSYNEKMPVVPIINTGLLPLAQLTILVPFTIWLSRRLETTKMKR